MAKINLPYTQGPIKGRQGHLYGYYRRAGQRVPLGRWGSPEFFAAYQRVHDSFEASGTAPSSTMGTMKALVEQYLASPGYAEKADKTKRDYRRYLDELAVLVGHLPVRTLTRMAVNQIRDKYAGTPRKALYMVQILSLICEHAIELGWITNNPAKGVKKPHQLAALPGGGHQPWSDWQINQFRTHWPLASWERTAFEMLLGTGQRGQDIAKMSCGHIGRDGFISVVQLKGGNRLAVPQSVALTEALAAWLHDHPHMAILAGLRGNKAPTASTLSHGMHYAFVAAGCEGMTVHGGRYTAATILHEIGLDWQTIGAITSQRTIQMVQQYTSKKRAAGAAIKQVDRRKV